jgi:hypothetical protein
MGGFFMTARLAGRRAHDEHNVRGAHLGQGAPKEPCFSRCPAAAAKPMLCRFLFPRRPPLYRILFPDRIKNNPVNPAKS